MTKLAYIYILVNKRVSKPSINVRANILLVGLELVERRRLIGDVRVHDILL
jgi:hypothetical protein